MLKNFYNKILGILICLIVAVTAIFISVYSPIPTMMACLLMGMALNFMSKASLTKDGVQYTSRSILRIGVALIGARIVLLDFTALGAPMIMLVILTTIAIIIFGVLLARVIGADKEQGLLIAGATAICGGSAALAIAASMPNSKNLEKNTLIAVIGVTAIGTIAMILYPLIIAILGFNDYEAGILIGGAIHDVAQVVGAGYSVSTDAGDSAVIIKLIRVSMLVPIVFILAFMFGRSKKRDEEKPPIVPLFIIGFIALAALNSFHLIPADITDILKNASKYMLMMAIVAVGMKTSFKEVMSLRWKPIALIIINTIAIFSIYLSILSINLFTQE